jgi:hypothetical protein
LALTMLLVSFFILLTINLVQMLLRRRTSETLAPVVAITH